MKLKLAFLYKITLFFRFLISYYNEVLERNDAKSINIAQKIVYNLFFVKNK